MHLQARLLWLVLLLAVFCPLAASGQSSTLTLRRGVIRSDPGVPTVQVIVDRRRVPLGTMVTFTLTPANVIRNPLYTVTMYFGDGKQQSVGTTEVSHLYRAVGTYIYSVQVKSTPRPPRVTLSATPVPAERSQPVNFSAQLSSNYPNIQYRFHYGDGNSSDWQDSPKSDYAYQSSGKYSAYVDIGEKKQPLGGSPRKIIDVTETRSLKVTLSANPPRARARQRVTFVANAVPASASTKYRFEFGDTTSTGWQTSSIASHDYKDAGNYRARVDVTQSDSGRSANASSAPAVIAVQGSAPRPTPGPTPAPTPRTNPSPSSTATPTSSSSPSPSASPTNGSSPSPSPTDGSSPSPSPTSSGSALSTTSPSPSGSTSPGQTGITTNGDNSSSNEGAGPFGTPGNWWKYLLIAALILFLIYQASGLLFVARPTFAPFSDPGVSTIDERAGGLPIDFQMVLDRNVSAGAYTVETAEPGLVKNADRLEERQILEI